MTENETKTAEQKKRDLYLRQKELLATLLEHGAISQAQYDKSLGDLTVKMGMEPNGEPKVWPKGKAQPVGMLQPDRLQPGIAPLKVKKMPNVQFKTAWKFPETGGKSRKKAKKTGSLRKFAERVGKIR